MITALEQFKEAAGIIEFLGPEVSVFLCQIREVNRVELGNRVEIVGLAIRIVDKPGNGGTDVSRSVRGTEGGTVGFTVMDVVQFRTDKGPDHRGIGAALASAVDGKFRSMGVRR